MNITWIVRVGYGYYPNPTLIKKNKKIKNNLSHRHSLSPMRNNNNNNSNHNNYSEERFNGRDFLLKWSYLFGFEHNLASERMVIESATTSPWRYRRGNFWSKRPSSFGSITKPRVFSFRYYRGMKSPFFRRRRFFPLSKRFTNSGNGVRGKSSRRTKSRYSTLVRPVDLSLISIMSPCCNGITPDAVVSTPTFLQISNGVYDLLHGLSLSLSLSLSLCLLA